MPSKDIEYPQGWLYRWSRNTFKSTWQKRYYILTDKELRYYKDQQGNELAGIIELRFYKSAIAYPTKKASFCFQITSRCTERKSYIISAENEQDRQLWIALIDSAIRDLVSKTMQRFNRRETEAVKDDDYSNSVLDKWLDRLDLNDDHRSGLSKYSHSVVSNDFDIIDRYASITPVLRSCQSIESLDTNSSLRSEPTTLSSGSTRSLLQSSFCSAISASSPGKAKTPEVVVTSSRSTPPLGSNVLENATKYLWQPLPRDSSLGRNQGKSKASSTTHSVA
ncbi:hypothetical protein CLU79DRAFT_714524 [Phycomyces nitens]|nr:hypothetical protein CLU79DRAFT_714524 [Phycomyces nitens]